MTEPHRILQLASFSTMGGTERMILFLVEAMDRARFESHVCCLIGNGDLIRRAEPICAGARHFQFHHPLDPRGIRALIRYLRDHRISLVHTYGLRADIAGRIAAKWAGVPVVFSGIRSIDPWRKWHHTLADRLTARAVDLWVSNSEAGRQATIAREKFPPDRIKVVYSGLPHREVPRDRRNDIRRSLGIEASAFPVVGILANIRDMKGHADVVRALPAILRECPGAVFLFAGRDDSQGAIAAQAAAAGVDHAIRFLGYRADTLPLLAAMDIFMLPSHWEGLPVSIIEAMHAALPVIATRVGGIPELITDGEDGLLIDAAQPAQLAAAVTRLTRDDTLRKSLAQAALARAQRDFSLQAMTSQMETLYAEWIGRKARVAKTAR